jgi:hypothetical protein
MEDDNRQSLWVGYGTAVLLEACTSKHLQVNASASVKPTNAIAAEWAKQSALAFLRALRHALTLPRLARRGESELKETAAKTPKV